MRRVAVTGVAFDVWPRGDGRNDAELLAPVVEAALAQSGLHRDEIGVVCSAGSEFLNGVVGTVMGAFDALPGWPPRAHTHLEGDGGFALHEAWVRLLAGEADAALVCAYARPLADEPDEVLARQHDPYLVAPLGVTPRQLAALQARSVLARGTYDERAFAAVVAARRGEADVDALLAAPYVASPLREADCSSICAGAAAVVLAVEEHATRSLLPPAWISAIDQRIDTVALGARDLTVAPSIATAAARVGVTGSSVDVAEVHAPYSHQELIVLDALGADVGAVNPSGGALPADPTMVTGLIRMGAAAEAIRRGDAQRSLGHATNGPCLQHNVLCVFERAGAAA